MTTIERRGKLITVVIAALAALPTLQTLSDLLFFGRRPIASNLVPDIVLLLVVSWPLFRGIRQGRILGIVVYGMGAGLAAVLLLVLWPKLVPGQLAALCLEAVICLAVALVLWRSTSVRAYFDRQDRRATSPLSGMGGA